MPKERSFQIGTNLRKNGLRFVLLQWWVGKAGVKGRDERKVRALDTVLHQTDPSLCSFKRPKAEKELDKSRRCHNHGAPAIG